MKDTGQGMIDIKDQCRVASQARASLDKGFVWGDLSRATRLNPNKLICIQMSVPAKIGNLVKFKDTPQKKQIHRTGFFQLLNLS